MVAYVIFRKKVAKRRLETLRGLAIRAAVDLHLECWWPECRGDNIVFCFSGRQVPRTRLIFSCITVCSKASKVGPDGRRADADRLEMAS